ncbi:MAG: glucose-6-phosphate dehydrogenase assembly protein OpcA [Actinobacteria bacterium]|nr:glucose-6-phosphate dehydrogenase assembly protein OpcA [Actinomycetota bacterium]MCG2800849.1 glucose-6-phosphate dehydrogenase assembly protein OpcA [Cellulomonas sp.]
MIIDLPDTTTRDINRRLVTERDEGGAVALGRVLTLIVDVAGRDPEEAIEAANAASHEHPCRIIVLSAHEAADTSRLDAQIRLGGDAGASEVVVLSPAGPTEQDLDTLVMPLLLPDAPIVVWWPYELPSDPSEHPLGRMSQRRITDSTQCTSPGRTLRQLAKVYAEGDTDLAWTRATLWRGLIAATLDQPPYEAVHSAVVSGESNHPSLDLMAAWLAQALRCPVTVERIPGAPAITQVRLNRSSGPIVLDRPDGKTAALRQPDQPEHRIALPIRQLRECLVEELRRLDADEVYGEVLTKGLARLGDQ